MDDHREQQTGYTQNNEKNSETTILTDEEKRGFQGVTLEEDGRGDYTETTVKSPYSQEDTNTRQQSFGTFKVYTWQDISWFKKIIIGLILVGILVPLSLFGGIILIGVVVVAIVGMILTLLRSLF